MYDAFIGGIRSFVQSIVNVSLILLILICNLTSQPFCCHPQLFTTPAPIMKELPDCGKRYIRKADEPKFGECFWNCEVGVIIINYTLLSA